MQLATFLASCKNANCLHEFGAPALSDFSYGEYLYGAIDGSAIRYYNGLDCATWDFIDHTLSAHFEKEDRNQIGSIIQKLIGLVADRPSPDIYFTQHIYCPMCKDKVDSIDLDQKVGPQDYPSLSFRGFSQLSSLKKKNRLSMIIDKYPI